MVWNEMELVRASHQHHCFFSPQRFLGQMTTFIIKEAMRVAAPRNSLHKDGVRVKVVAGNILSEGAVELIPSPAGYTAISRCNR